MTLQKHPRNVILGSALAVVAIATSAAAGPPALDPPPDAVVAEGRLLVERMRTNERGPYSRIRWYCADGTVLPPEPYACREHGGGRQHAEYSADRDRLAALGWPVGTILAATSHDELFDAAHRNRRLRMLLVERYLVEVDDGWVMRRARFYRGHVQVEDEEAAGQESLAALLGRGAWVADNYLLAREAVRTLPHDAGSDRTRTIRRLSQEIAERDRSFEPLRVKIHTSPGAADVAAVRTWIEAARGRPTTAESVATAEELVRQMEALYGADDAWVAAATRALRRDPRWPALEPLVAAAAGTEGVDRRRALAAALAASRDLLPASDNGRRNVALMDLSLALERELVREAFIALQAEQLPRIELLELADALLDGVYGSGLLSARERDDVRGAIGPLLDDSSPDIATYVDAVQRLRRVAVWSHGTVRYTFAEPLVWFGALEPKARRWADDVLRGSALLPLAETVTSLAADADRLTVVEHRLFGHRYGGILGLNPGVARGRLRIVGAEEAATGVEAASSDIVVLPRTVSDLTPVAGILTLAEGNLLSHVQLLARNLGIPNVTVAPTLAAELTAHDGQQVVLAVGSDGSVVLEATTAIPEEAWPAVGLAEGTAPTREKLDAPAPDLSVRTPIPLAGLSSSLAGSVVGPKAAHLGELARLFPGRVEQAIALPFGIFAEHVTRGPDSAKSRLDAAYVAHRAGTIDDAGLVAAVAAVYDQVAGTSLEPALLATLEPMMQTLFGPAGSYGVFVRSDTNVEDLPGFTGAGLNETIPNVVGTAALERAIARVWASPFRERAVAWRAPLLNRPEEVYTSVLLMKSVAAEKSGVMVTKDLVRRRPGLTVATAWGVGGAVDGDAAETVVLAPDGSVLLVGEAKAPFRRALRADGGVEWLPAASGRVLSAAEQGALRALAAEIGERLEPHLGPDGAPLPWDVEFGFVSGRLQLFQIRPLVERGSARADRAVAALVPPPPAVDGRVALAAPIPLRSVPMTSTER